MSGGSLSGVLSLCTVGRFQFPRSHKQTSSSLPPLSMFLTAVTAMAGNGEDAGVIGMLGVELEERSLLRDLERAKV